jgi:hypothetical protein
MNALANSQIKEIEKFISQSGLPDDVKPIVRRYTGQESSEDRQKIADNPPDILLTNFMMAELLLTRQDKLDSQVIDNAKGSSSSCSMNCNLSRPSGRGCCDPRPPPTKPLRSGQGSYLYRHLRHDGERRV